MDKSKIEDLLKKREEIDTEIQSGFMKPVTLLFTDIVGSTRYFEEMGDIAGRQMIQKHNDLLFPIITSAGGKVIKTIGDSIMATFENPEAGVACAVSMQEDLRSLNSELDDDKKIRVRMGLHYGRAVVDEKDLFGDMVNTAARVESRAEGEEIVISSSLADMCDKNRFPMVSLGSDTVKGKSKEIDFFLVNWNGRASEEILSSWKGRIKARPAEETAQVKTRPIIVRNVLAGKPIVSPSNAGNPYLNRVMIPHPSMFFGREVMVKRIISRLHSEKPQSVSIVGERRIGKSSLLNFLNFPETRRAYFKETEKYIFTFVDFQAVRSGGTLDVIAAIFSELKRQVDCEIDQSVSRDFDGLRALCQCLTEDGYRLILFFDEFESITKNEAIGPDFYSFFRSLANNYGVAYVTASGRNLKDMCVSRQISDSPFFNIFVSVYLGLFLHDEALALVTKPSAECGIPLAAVASAIIEEGGLYPFFLQMMCAAWYDFLESEGKEAVLFEGKPSPRGVLSLFREESEPHFEYIVETMTEGEKSVISGLARGNQPPTEDRYAEILARRGYLVRSDDGTYAPFGKEFGIFLSRKFVGR